MSAAKSARRDLLARLGDRLEPSPMPATPLPMLCTLEAEAFDNPDWIVEPSTTASASSASSTAGT
jgi:hypothetical protein